MGFWEKLFGEEKKRKPCEELRKQIPEEPDVINEEIPGALNLGWYWSENKRQHQMAKIAEKDRVTHMYVIGATGTGKTKFLESLIHQDIEKGNGFGVIDPHGDLIESLKGFLAMQYERSGDKELITERLILVDPTDPEYTVTFNPLEKLPNVSVPEQVNELISAFRKIWSDSWGVRMEDLMRNSLIALGEGEFTLAELPPFLSNRAFRKMVIEKVQHPIAREYFQRFDNLTDRGQAPWIEPVMNKINSFFADERIREMFSSATQSSFNLREIMDQKKMLFIKLDKGRLKDTADLLGSLLMAKIQMAAFSRSDIPPSRRVPFHMYIDEFQNFASDSFAVILSEARKYGLSLTLAHQTLAQIPVELRSLILGNAGLQVYFRVNRQDAALLAKEIFEYSGYEVKTVKKFEPVFWSLGEEWEHKTNELQTLQPRCCWAKHKIEGGIVALQTVDLAAPWELLDTNEHEYLSAMKQLPFGRKYAVARKTLVALEQKRQLLIGQEIEVKVEREREKVEAVKLPPEAKPTEHIERRDKVPIAPAKEKRVRTDIPVFEGTGGSQHRYLQSLIKRIAEEKGFRAVIEEKTPDGLGSVDVGLVRDGKHLACEICLTTTDEHELGNIRKCLAAGYDQVILCAPERKTLEKIRSSVARNLEATEQARIFFFQPEELFFFLEQEAAKSSGTVERVKGYKVKVQYQPMQEGEKKNKREAVGQVVAQALKRLKGKN